MKDEYAAGSVWWWRRDFNDGRGPVPPRLHPGDIEAIARRVAELLRGTP